MESKDDLHKYQVAFDQDLEQADFQGLDLLHWEKAGRVYQMVIRGKKEEVMQTLREKKPLLLDVLPVNFEELFIYEVESRGSLDE